MVASEFLNNTAHASLTTLPFSISAGGIAFSSHNAQFVNISFRVSDCAFADNSALQTASRLTTTENTALKRYSGRGGGIGAALGATGGVYISVENCTFTGNTAQVFGGGLYIITNATRHNYTIVDCTFVDNTADTAGGGLGLSLLSEEHANTTNLAQVKNCNFVDNCGRIFGGGMYILPGMFSENSYNIHIFCKSWNI